MGHLMFIFLHLVAIVFAGGLLLFVTIPAHIIYAAVRSNRPSGEKTSRWTHVKCPACQELVIAEATVCKHCGSKLVPTQRSAFDKFIAGR